MRTIAALYIDPRGPYPHIHGVESWGLPYRDARRYDGPHPVVAHPPCGPWGRLKHLSKRPDDALLAFHALAQVRAFGGVLEHPAGSTFWAAAELPKPEAPPDRYGGRTIAVTQSDFGHVARKPTWLYLVGIPESAVTPAPFPGRVPTHWVSGSRGEHPTRTGLPVPAGIKVCSVRQRRRTPPLFAAWLIALARASVSGRPIT